MCSSSSWCPPSSGAASQPFRQVPGWIWNSWTCGGSPAAPSTSNTVPNRSELGAYVRAGAPASMGRVVCSGAGPSGEGAGADQAVLVGVDDGLDPVTQAEFGQDAADVGLDGCLGQEEPLGDLGVGVAGGDLDEDLAFPHGQLAQLGRFRGGGGGAGQVGQERVEEPAGDGGGDDRVPAGDGADRRQQVRRRDVLEQEAAGTGAQPGVGVLVEVEGGE